MMLSRRDVAGVIHIVLLLFLFALGASSSLAQLSDPEFVVPPPGSARSVLAADVDGDGDHDLLSSSWIQHADGSTQGETSWFENTDGLGTFSVRQTIADEGSPDRCAVAADLNGDGNLDILLGSVGIAWFDNIAGTGRSWEKRIIDASEFCLSIAAADLDGDGDLDVVNSRGSGDGMAWYENTDGLGSFGPRRPIPLADFGIDVLVYAADLDGDGDVDLLTSRRQYVGWVENVDGNGTFSPEEIIYETSPPITRTLFAADVDGDGDLDPIYGTQGDISTSSRLAWHPNEGGTFGSQQLIVQTGPTEWPTSVETGDLDGDGDLDVVSAWAGTASNHVYWSENIDGRGTTFGSPVPVTEAVWGAGSVAVADLDGDGDNDVASVNRGAVAWSENVDALGTFGAQSYTTTPNCDCAARVAVGDLDGDGDDDLVAGALRTVWYANEGSSFGGEKLIADGIVRAISVGDLDGDGDQDVVTHTGRLSWHENLDGRGTFGVPRIISSSGRRNMSMSIGDIDGDGDLDVLETSGDFNPTTVKWHENVDGKGNFVLGGDLGEFANWTSLVDLDLDGDLDALLLGAELISYINADGVGGLVPSSAVMPERSSDYHPTVVDVDGDGFADVVLGGKWYRNDGHGTFALAGAPAEPGGRVDGSASADLDRDGDPDMLVTLNKGSANPSTLFWNENLDAEGAFGDRLVAGTDLGGLRSLAIWDPDGDDDADVLAVSREDRTITWYQNLTPLPDVHFESSPVVNATKDKEYRYEVFAIADVPVLAAVHLPPWLAFVDEGNGRGVLWGIPQEANVGPNPVQLRVTGASGSFATQSFLVDVMELPSIPTLETPPDGSESLPTSVSFTWQKSRSATSYTIQIGLDSLLAQVVFASATSDTTWTVAGLSESTVYWWRVAASNNVGASGWSPAWSFITADPPNMSPGFASEPITEATEDELYRYDIATFDPEGDAVALTAPTLPAWLNFVDNGDGTGALAGTPGNDDVGEHEVAIVADDGIAEVRRQNFTIVVSNTNDPPTQPTLLSPPDGATLVVQGDASKLFRITWTKSVDIDPFDKVSYRWELNRSQDFLDANLITIETDTNRIAIVMGVLDSLLARAGLSLTETIALYHTVAATDREVEVSSDTLNMNLVRGVITSVDDTGLPTQFALYGNFPNPFNPSTSIHFDLPRVTYVRLVVFDLLGRQVATVVDKRMGAGRHSVTLAAGDLPSGVYLYRIDAGDFRQTRQMLLLK